MSAAPFRWPLATCPFDEADKREIAKWIVSTDRFTMGEKVRELEAKFSEFSGAHALMVANGSVANQLIFELWKVKNPGVKPVVICPAVTWVSSITPAIMAGMDVVFCDVNTEDFSFDYEQLDWLVSTIATQGRRIIIWPTALIGFVPDMFHIHDLARFYGADVYLDSCENTFSWVDQRSILASADMVTTSGYMSHQVTMIEGGFVFFRNRPDWELGSMFRNHGLSRSLPAGHPERVRIERDHPDVDPQFLFALPGTNLRPTDIHAMFGLMDFKRIPQSIEHRNRIYRLFHERLDHSAYYLPPLSDTHVGFCLPIFACGDNLPQIKAALNAAGIENRPLIGGCLLMQPIFRTFGDPKNFPNALWFHHHACYVGLHSGVTETMVIELTTLLNEMAKVN